MKAEPIIPGNQIHLPLLEDFEKAADQVDESDPELLSFFEEEAAEVLGKMESLLQAWNAPKSGCPCPLNDLRICLHTLKGAANSIGQLRIGSLAHGMKDVLDMLKPTQIVVMRADLTKVSITVMEAIKVLLCEAHAPKYNRARKELILRAVHSILDLKQKVTMARSAL
jgi:chemotaxis protein histidine kinase CheA